MSGSASPGSASPGSASPRDKAPPRARRSQWGRIMETREKFSRDISAYNRTLEQQKWDLPATLDDYVEAFAQAHSYSPQYIAQQRRTLEKGFEDFIASQQADYVVEEPGSHNDPYGTPPPQYSPYIRLAPGAGQGQVIIENVNGATSTALERLRERVSSGAFTDFSEYEKAASKLVELEEQVKSIARQRQELTRAEKLSKTMKDQLDKGTYSSRRRLTKFANAIRGRDNLRAAKAKVDPLVDSRLSR